MARSQAAIAGVAEWAPQRVWDRPMFALEAMAELAAEALADAGLDKREVDGLVIGHVPESPMFGPSAAAEYLAVRANFAETVDLGGASACGMIWRAAAAIELGAGETALVLCPMVPAPPPEGDESRKMLRYLPFGPDGRGNFHDNEDAINEIIANSASNGSPGA